MASARTKISDALRPRSSPETATETPVFYDVADDARWIATVPSVPGAVGCARTHQAARKKVLTAAKAIQQGKEVVVPEIEPPHKGGSIPWKRQLALRKAHPSLLRLMADKPTGRGPDEAIRRGGIECEPGWLRLLDRLFTRIDRITVRLPPRRRPAVCQIKEKFALLRIYFDDRSKVSEAIEKAICDAELASCRTCERCGRRGKIRRSRNWFFARCARCWGQRGAVVHTWRLRQERRFERAKLADKLNVAERRKIAKPVGIAAIEKVLPGRRLRLRLTNGTSVERDFSRFKDGVFERFTDTRYFRRVRLVRGVLTWPGRRGWRADQVVDLLPEAVVWGVCPAPFSADPPPASLVLRDKD